MDVNALLGSIGKKACFTWLKNAEQLDSFEFSNVAGQISRAQWKQCTNGTYEEQFRCVADKLVARAGISNLGAVRQWLHWLRWAQGTVEGKRFFLILNKALHSFSWGRDNAHLVGQLKEVLLNMMLRITTKREDLNGTIALEWVRMAPVDLAGKIAALMIQQPRDWSDIVIWVKNIDRVYKELSGVALTHVMPDPADDQPFGAPAAALPSTQPPLDIIELFDLLKKKGVTLDTAPKLCEAVIPKSRYQDQFGLRCLLWNALLDVAQPSSYQVLLYFPLISRHCTDEINKMLCPKGATNLSGWEEYGRGFALWLENDDWMEANASSNVSVDFSKRRTRAKGINDVPDGNHPPGHSVVKNAFSYGVPAITRASSSHFESLLIDTLPPAAPLKSDCFVRAV